MAKRKRPIGDPRKLGGRMVDAAGDPLARAGVVLDTTNAVLMDGVEVCLVDVVKAPPRVEAPTGPPPSGAHLAMALRGRVNKSSDRAEVLYLFDEDGAAAIVTELLGLAYRIGPEFAERFIARTEEVLRASRPTDG